MNVDRADIVRRLRAVLPFRWFGDTTPVLDTLLNGLAAGWEENFGLLQYTRRQSRIATATEEWLDFIGYDFFGFEIARVAGQSDDSYRKVLQHNILRLRGTRTALASALTDLTGRSPAIFEPRNTGDSGGYSSGGAGYCAAGGWGSLELPFQLFVTAFRPRGNGTANVSGWSLGGGGYGAGALEYVDMDIVHGRIDDQQIASEVVRTAPAGVVVWLKIAS